MNKQHYSSVAISFKKSLVAGAVLFGLSVNSQLHAAPGTIADSPLFLSSIVQPNIFFMIDDSGSMDWEILKSSGALAIGAYAGFPNSGNLDITPTSNDRDEILESCAGYNVLYYNPNITYTPWRGTDSAGNPYADQSITAARWDPYNPGAGTVNLTSADGLGDRPGYMVWTDDGDGVFEIGECPDPGLAGYNHAASYTNTLAMSAAEQTNFANWFSYYRKREYVGKRALSELVQESTARMGFSLINNLRTGWSTPIRDVDDVSVPVDLTARANKATLLDRLTRFNSSGGTPLRRGLEDAGEYFEGDFTGSWATPIQSAADGGECQQNFTILLSDGYWNGWNPNVGNADSDNNTAFDGGSHADANNNVSNTLADVAMHFYERDLSPLDNKVPTITGVDENDAQHMVTFAVAFGINGTLNADPADRTTPFAWPTPTANNATTIDDMRHAGWNGRGSYLSARDPNELINGLTSAIANIQSRTGTAAAVTFNSTSLQTGTEIYQAAFDSARWSGDLAAKPIDLNGNVGAERWKATTGSTSTADLKGLDERDYTLRNIFTYDGTNNTGISFDWNTITTDMKNDLRTNKVGGTDNEATGMARMGFIKGDRACETSAAGTCNYNDGSNTFNSKSFRSRASRLGDIVHSAPFYVGQPSASYPESIEASSYAAFAKAKASRTGVVYVGSNGGMLHAFNADNSGQELFAYIPSMLFSNQIDEGLHLLTHDNYQHQYFVDLSPRVADAYIGGSWKTILVGGLRAGGKGIFALDVTNPTSFSSNDILWEFTNNDLGYTFSEVRIGKLNNGKWAAIFGNGYNNDPLGDGKAKLFILYLDGSNVNSPIIINTGAGNMNNNDCNDASSDCNGLSTPALADLNGDGIIDRAYAGDLHGNMWAFDLSSNSSISWGSAYGSNPLFKACPTPCTVGNRQPITSKPSLARHLSERSNSTAPNIMVFFGTGQYITSTDNVTNTQQTFYGIWDGNSGNLNRTNLTAQTISTASSSGVTYRFLSDTYVNFPSTKGWYIDLPTGKERVVVDSITIGELVFFNTMIPSTSVCSGGGSSWLMLANQFNGGEPSFPAFDTNGDGVIDDNDLINGKVAVGTQIDGIATSPVFIGDTRVVADSRSQVTSDQVRANIPTDPFRSSWTNVDVR